ncbi:hypothetical protein [Limnofasciculus baicalensis]|uniref:Uncharacterized protein n=1 Tax=Limnofasciculus baicalensis BBK-W-15 TaxID=2699891 RepID=A0AAE3GW47_9CYAN|nr:hypothetical protein [Limnofasciculus baicalensis]MCP2730863.1 hypothetical protein [Limnofasciculus baicalensis BBK-W-15]
MQNQPAARYSSSTQSNAYCPSVPISVYRELAAELQAAQAMLDSLNSQNQQLVKQNQQLRQEVEKVLNATHNLQQVVTSFPPVGGYPQGVPPENEGSFRQPVMQSPNRKAAVSPPPPSSGNVPGIGFPPPRQKSEPASYPYGETMVIEQDDNRYRRTLSRENSSEINGWLLILAIVAIVLTAFGTGFVIVRPLLGNNR